MPLPVMPKHASPTAFTLLSQSALQTWRAIADQLAPVGPGRLLKPADFISRFAGGLLLSLSESGGRSTAHMRRPSAGESIHSHLDDRRRRSGPSAPTNGRFLIAGER